jgi:hypothetical protein
MWDKSSWQHGRNGGTVKSCKFLGFEELRRMVTRVVPTVMHCWSINTVQCVLVNTVTRPNKHQNINAQIFEMSPTYFNIMISLQTCQGYSSGLPNLWDLSMILGWLLDGACVVALGQSSFLGSISSHLLSSTLGCLIIDSSCQEGCQLKGGHLWHLYEESGWMWLFIGCSWSLLIGLSAPITVKPTFDILVSHIIFPYNLGWFFSIYNIHPSILFGNNQN